MVNSQEQSIALSAYQQYMSQVRHTPELTEAEECELLQRLKTDDGVQQARKRLVEGYQGLIVGLARRFAHRCREMEFLDLVQEGNIGFLQALERYDGERREASFRTFAFSWVRGCMLVALWQYEGLIRLPLQKTRVIRLMNEASARLLLQLKREPTVAEIAGEMGLQEREVRELVVLQEQEVISLHSPLDEEGETLLEDVVENAGASGFADGGSSVMENALARLTASQQRVFKLRYGLDGGKAHTQQEVADVLGVATATVAESDRMAKLQLRKVLKVAVV